MIEIGSFATRAVAVSTAESFVRQGRVAVVYTTTGATVRYHVWVAPLAATTFVGGWTSYAAVDKAAAAAAHDEPVPTKYGVLRTSLEKALAVLLLAPETRSFLDAVDPKAVEQAERALLGSTGGAR